MTKAIVRMGLAAALACAWQLLPAQPTAAQVAKEKVYEVRKGDGLKIEGKLTADDPKDSGLKNSHHKLYLVKLAAGKTYTIRMNAADEQQIDAVLRVEDAAKKQLAFNDDAPGENTLNSRIDFKCEKDGTYRIIATSLNGGAVGDYTVLIKIAD